MKHRKFTDSFRCFKYSSCNSQFIVFSLFLTVCEIGCDLSSSNEKLKEISHIVRSIGEIFQVMKNSLAIKNYCWVIGKHIFVDLTSTLHVGNISNFKCTWSLFNVRTKENNPMIIWCCEISFSTVRHDENLFPFFHIVTLMLNLRFTRF